MKDRIYDYTVYDTELAEKTIAAGNYCYNYMGKTCPYGLTGSTCMHRLYISESTGFDDNGTYCDRIRKSYTIYRTSSEVKGKVETGCTPYTDGQEWEKIESFATLDEAREALKGFKSSKRHMSGAVPFELVEEFFISEYDPEAEDANLDIWDFAEWEEA